MDLEADLLSFLCFDFSFFSPSSVVILCVFFLLLAVIQLFLLTPPPHTHTLSLIPDHFFTSPSFFFLPKISLVSAPTCSSLLKPINRSSKYFYPPSLSSSPCSFDLSSFLLRFQKPASSSSNVALPLHQSLVFIPLPLGATRKG